MYQGRIPLAMYAWWAAGRRVRMGACQWAGMWCAADIGMSRGDCAATYAGIVINDCICTRTQVQWRFGGNICVTGCKRPVGVDGHGATAISVRGVGVGPTQVVVHTRAGPTVCGCVGAALTRT